MKQNPSDNHESNLKPGNEQKNLSSATVIEPASAPASPPVPPGAEDTTATLEEAETLVPAATPTATPSPNPAQANTPDPKPALAKPESAAKAGRSGGGTKPGKQSSPAVATTKPKMVRVDRDFAEALNRMEHLIKQRTRLGAAPLQMIDEVIDASDDIMKEIKDAWFFLVTPESYSSLHEKLNRAQKVQEELSQIAVVGKVISKFALDQDRVAKLKLHAEALKAYFGRVYRPRDVLVLLWQRGGILVAEALSRPQGQS